MRLILSLGFIVGLIDLATAHTLPGNESMASQLSHQILSLHHLPLFALLFIGGLFLLRHLYKADRHNDNSLK